MGGSHPTARETLRSVALWIGCRSQSRWGLKAAANASLGKFASKRYFWWHAAEQALSPSKYSQSVRSCWKYIAFVSQGSPHSLTTVLQTCIKVVQVRILISLP